MTRVFVDTCMLKAEKHFYTQYWDKVFYTGEIRYATN
jgi:hypothetical protein